MVVTGASMVKLNQMLKAMRSKKVILVYRLELRTTPGIIRSYFENYGPVEQVYRGISIQKGAYSGPGLVQFKDVKTVEDVMMQRKHTVDTKEVVVNVCNSLPNQMKKYEGWQDFTMKDTSLIKDNKIPPQSTWKYLQTDQSGSNSKIE